jgi:hypothetical protein
LRTKIYEVRLFLRNVVWSVVTWATCLDNHVRSSFWFWVQRFSPWAVITGGTVIGLRNDKRVVCRSKPTCFARCTESGRFQAP